VVILSYAVGFWSVSGPLGPIQRGRVLGLGVATDDSFDCGPRLVVLGHRAGTNTAAHYPDIMELFFCSVKAGVSE